MRKVYIRVYADVILTMDEGVNLSDAIAEATPTLGIQDDRVTEIDFQIPKFEIQDSK